MTDLDPKDLLIDVFSRSGWVNMASHGVMITHKPTGLSVKKDDPVPYRVNQAAALEELTKLVEMRKETE